MDTHRKILGTIKHVQLASIQHNREVVARLRAQSNAQPHPIGGQAGRWTSTTSGYDDYLVKSAEEINALQD